MDRVRLRRRWVVVAALSLAVQALAVSSSAAVEPVGVPDAAWGMGSFDMGSTECGFNAPGLLLFGDPADTSDRYIGVETVMSSPVFGPGVLRMCGTIGGAFGSPPSCAAFSGRDGVGTVEYANRRLRLSDVQWDLGSTFQQSGGLVAFRGRATSDDGARFRVDGRMVLQGGFACADSDGLRRGVMVLDIAYVPEIV